MTGDWISDYIAAAYTLPPDGVLQIGKRIRYADAASHDIAETMTLHSLSFTGNMRGVKMKQSVSSGTEQAATHGLLVHELLSRVRVPADIDRVVGQSQVTGQLSAEMADAVKEALSAIVKHPDLEKYFKPAANNKTEAEIITGEGEVLRPDNVAFTNDHVAIIDYKTGEERTHQHAAQLARYENALRAMGYDRIKKLLVYVDQKKVIALN
jgi:hypothetical protein